MSSCNRKLKFFPSQIAQLVLGYLKEVQCYESHKKFLFECPYLLDCRQLYEQGEEFNPTFGFDGPNTLVTILQEYGRLKAVVDSKVNTHVTSNVPNSNLPRTPLKTNARSIARSTEIQRHRLASFIRSSCSPNKLPIPRTSALCSSPIPIVTSPATSTPAGSPSVAGTTRRASAPSNRPETFLNVIITPPQSSQSFTENSVQTEKLSDNASSQDSSGTIGEQNTEVASCSPLGPALSLLRGSPTTTPSKNTTISLERKTSSLSSSSPSPLKLQQCSSLLSKVVTPLRLNSLTDTSRTPTKTCPPPRYRRAPDTNSPRLILSHERSEVPSLSTPNYDFREDVMRSPKRKSIIPRRRLVPEIASPCAKKSENRDRQNSSLQNNESQVPVVAGIVEFLNRPPVVEKIAESINSVKINTPFKSATIPECDQNFQGDLIKEVLEELQRDQIFENVLNIGDDMCDFDSTMFLSPNSKECESRPVGNSNDSQTNKNDSAIHIRNPDLPSVRSAVDHNKPKPVAGANHAHDSNDIELIDLTEENEMESSRNTTMYAQPKIKFEYDISLPREITETNRMPSFTTAPEDILSTKLPSSETEKSLQVTSENNEIQPACTTSETVATIIPGIDSLRATNETNAQAISAPPVHTANQINPVQVDNEGVSTTRSLCTATQMVTPTITRPDSLQMVQRIDNDGVLTQPLSTGSQVVTGMNSTLSGLRGNNESEKSLVPVVATTLTGMDFSQLTKGLNIVTQSLRSKNQIDSKINPVRESSGGISTMQTQIVPPAVTGLDSPQVIQGMNNESIATQLLCREGQIIPSADSSIVRMDPLQVAMSLNNIGDVSDLGIMESGNYSQLYMLPNGQIVSSPVIPGEPKNLGHKKALPKKRKRDDSLDVDDPSSTRPSSYRPKKKKKKRIEKNIFVTSQKMRAASAKPPTANTAAGKPKLPFSKPPSVPVDKCNGVNNNSITSSMKSLISFACEVVGGRDAGEISPEGNRISSLNLSSPTSKLSTSRSPMKVHLLKIFPNAKNPKETLPVRVIIPEKASSSKLPGSPVKLISQVPDCPKTIANHFHLKNDNLEAIKTTTKPNNPKKVVESATTSNPKSSGQSKKTSFRVKDVPNLPAGIKVPRSWKKTEVNSYADTLANEIASKGKPNILQKLVKEKNNTTR